MSRAEDAAVHGPSFLGRLDRAIELWHLDASRCLPDGTPTDPLHSARPHALGFLEHVDAVWSRDGESREYVQHRLQAQAERLRAWVADGATLAICGSADTMVPGVEATLVDLLGPAGLQALIDAGNYRRDVY